jgi:hypothetical protein
MWIYLIFSPKYCCKGSVYSADSCWVATLWTTGPVTLMFQKLPRDKEIITSSHCHIIRCQSNGTSKERVTLDHLGWLDLISWTPKSGGWGRRVGHRAAMWGLQLLLLALKVEHVATSPVLLVAPRSWKSKETDSLPEPPGKSTALPTVWFLSGGGLCQILIYRNGSEPPSLISVPMKHLTAMIRESRDIWERTMGLVLQFLEGQWKLIR